VVASFSTYALLQVIDVPGIVFMRGGAVGVLVILHCEGREYTILTCQARVPVGDSNLPEIPAGMLDGSGNFKGVAAQELEQECELAINTCARHAAVKAWGRRAGRGRERGELTPRCVGPAHSEGVGLLPVARSEQLVNLTGLAFGEKWRGLMPSAGGCDEFIRLYLFQQEVTPEQLQTFEG
jgi:ADP-sugar diphosphatase